MVAGENDSSQSVAVVSGKLPCYSYIAPMNPTGACRVDGSSFLYNFLLCSHRLLIT